MITILISIVIAYLIGSISNAIIVSKLMNIKDPRTNGSGNPGASNVLRLGGKYPAIIVLVADILKGLIAVMLARIVGVEGFTLGLVAIAAVIGHMFPAFFHFQGGKGVATALGGFFALSPIIGILVALSWVVIAALFRYASLASLVAAMLAPAYTLIFTNTGYTIPVIIITALILWRHQANIKRLRTGTEPKMGQT